MVIVIEECCDTYLCSYKIYSEIIPQLYEHSAVPIHSSCSLLWFEIIRGLIHLKTKIDCTFGETSSEDEFDICKRIRPNCFTIKGDAEPFK